MQHLDALEDLRRRNEQLEAKTRQVLRATDPATRAGAPRSPAPAADLDESIRTEVSSAVSALSPVRMSPGAAPAPASPPATQTPPRQLEQEVRMQAAKVRVLGDELRVAHTEVERLQTQLTAALGKVKQLEDAAAASEKKSAKTHNEAEKYKRLAEEWKQRFVGKESEVAALCKDLDALQRERRKDDQSGQSKGLRLNRALEEIERLKTALKDSEQAKKDGLAAARRRQEKTEAENKQLVKQRQEFLHVFKKQQRLVDILKRQKIHMESASKLALREEELAAMLATQTQR